MVRLSVPFAVAVPPIVAVDCEIAFRDLGSRAGEDDDVPRVRALRGRIQAEQVRIAADDVVLTSAAENDGAVAAAALDVVVAVSRLLEGRVDVQ